MPVYDYRCEAGHVTEEKQPYGVHKIPCPACGRTASRVAAYAEQYIIGETVAKGVCNASRLGNVIDKHGRYRVSLFQEASAEIDHAHKKAENEAGHELPSPPLYKEAMKRARQVRQAIP